MGIEDRIDDLEDKIDEQNETINVLKRLIKKLIDGEDVTIETYSEKCGIWNHEEQKYCDGEIRYTILDTVEHICPKCGKNVDDDVYIRRCCE